MHSLFNQIYIFPFKIFHVILCFRWFADFKILRTCYKRKSINKLDEQNYTKPYRVQLLQVDNSVSAFTDIRSSYF